jgi:hypothetical protein
MDRFKIIPLIKIVCKLTGSLIGMNRQQDIEIFHRLDTILNEHRLQKILNYSFFTECLQSEEKDLLYKFVAALQSVEHQYVHPVIERRAKTLASQLSQLLHTVDSTFSSDDGVIFHFRPDPADPAAYDREWEHLHHEVEQTWNAYKTYRQVVKDHLKL